MSCEYRRANDSVGKIVRRMNELMLVLITLSCASCFQPNSPENFDYPPLACAASVREYVFYLNLHDAAETPIPNATIKIVKQDQESFMINKDAGLYGGHAWEAGNYELQISAPGFQNKTISPFIVAHSYCGYEVTDLNINLER